MKKQALAIAIASALVAPSAFAAQDTSGMHFTSASEGFYASIRARFVTANNDNNGSDVQDASSRIGIRGNNDLGGGLEGFYQWELGVPINNGGDTSVRMGHVGLRGAFGSFWVGSNWAADYNWTHGSTDIANTHSGFFNYTDDRPGRTSNAIEYTTPDLNGFQGAVRLNIENNPTAEVPSSITFAGVDPSGNVQGTENEGSPAAKDDNDIDTWNIAANYAVQGFSVAGAYNVRADALGKRDAAGEAAGMDDANSWTFKLGYSQDNWYVNGWYGEDNTSDGGYTEGSGSGATAVAPAKLEDRTTFAIGGGVSVDKVNLYALFEQQETPIKQEDSYGTIGAQYNLGSQSRVWIEYTTNDYDSDADLDDYVNIGMRHDF